MPLGTKFNEWLKEQGKEPVNEGVEELLNEIGGDMYAERAAIAAGIAKAMAIILQQEYKKHEGRWWLWTLGKPARPLTDAEIEEKGL